MSEERRRRSALNWWNGRAGYGSGTRGAGGDGQTGAQQGKGGSAGGAGGAAPGSSTNTGGAGVARDSAVEAVGVPRASQAAAAGASVLRERPTRGDRLWRARPGTHPTDPFAPGSNGGDGEVVITYTPLLVPAAMPHTILGKNATIKSNGKTKVTSANPKTTTGQSIKTSVTCSWRSRGDIRLCRSSVNKRCHIHPDVRLSPEDHDHVVRGRDEYVAGV